MEIHLKRRLGLTLALPFLLVGCGDGPDGGSTGPRSPPEPTGSIQVVLRVSGAGTDPDGGRVTVDSGASSVLVAGASHTFRGLTPGIHELTISGVALNCSVAGETERSVKVIATLATPVVFSLDCLALEGVIAFNTNRGGDYDIFTMAADGTNPVNLTNHPARDLGGSLSPDGKQIAFASDRDGDYEIYSMDSDGSSVVQLTNKTARDNTPDWSPDGTRIAFVRRVGGNWGNQEIFVMNADGSNPVNITNYPDSDWGPKWSPDATQILFTRYDPTTLTNSVLVMNPDGSNPVELFNGRCLGSRDWSPDGTRIAYTVGCTLEDADIYVINTDGTGRINLTDRPGGDRFPVWSPDGKHIAFSRFFYFDDAIDGEYDVFVMRCDGSNPVRLTSDRGDDIPTDWSPGP